MILSNLEAAHKPFAIASLTILVLDVKAWSVSNTICLPRKSHVDNEEPKNQQKGLFFFLQGSYSLLDGRECSSKSRLDSTSDSAMLLTHS